MFYASGGGLNVRFIGIGGISMSALAKLTILKGHTVTGSDLSYSKRVEELNEWGVTAVTGSDPSAVDSADLVVFNAAVPADDPELSRAIELNKRRISRAAFLGESFDIEIIEKHHHLKKDAPSGTALMLAESANEGAGGKKHFVYGREGMVGARDGAEIGIHAVRGGTIVGEHEVLFAGEDEILTLAHSARSKKVFAAGALRAAKFLHGKTAGKYDMNDVLAAL